MERKSVTYPNEYLKSPVNEGKAKDLFNKIDTFMAKKFVDVIGSVALRGVDFRELEEEDLDTLREMLEKRRYQKQTIDIIMNYVRKKAKL